MGQCLSPDYFCCVPIHDILTPTSLFIIYHLIFPHLDFLFHLQILQTILYNVSHLNRFLE